MSSVGLADWIEESIVFYTPDTLHGEDWSALRDRIASGLPTVSAIPPLLLLQILTLIIAAYQSGQLTTWPGVVALAEQILTLIQGAT